MILLTKNGLLVVPQNDQPYFCDNTGFLRRVASQEEVNHLATICHHIRIEDESWLPHNQPTFQLDTLELENTDTVKNLAEMGIDYFSYSTSDLPKKLRDTEFSRIFNQWTSTTGNGADVRVELGKRKNGEYTVIVLLDHGNYNESDWQVVSFYPFTEQGIEDAISEMYSYLEY